MRQIVSHTLFLCGSNKTDKPFIGRIKDDKFIISLGRSSFLQKMLPPIVIGKITEKQNEIIIKVVIRLRIIEYLELLLFVLMLGISIMISIDSSFVPEMPYPAILAPIIMCAMIIFWMYQFNKWASRSADILIDALK